MRNRNAKLVLGLLGALLLFAQQALGDSQLRCLETSQGKTLRWFAGWDPDGQDGNMLYRIESVTSQNKMPNRIVTLELKAYGNAVRSTRKITVSAEDTARSVCERLTMEGTKIIDPSIFERPKDTKLEEHEPIQPDGGLPYIEYTTDGWVRADAPPGGGTYTECTVLQRRFRCLEEHKARFGNALKAAEEELLWKP